MGHRAPSCCHRCRTRPPLCPSQCVSVCSREPPRGADTPSIHQLNRGPGRQRLCVPTCVCDVLLSCQSNFSPTSEDVFLVLVPDHQVFCIIFIYEETLASLLSILSWSLQIGSLIRQEPLRKSCFKDFITTLVLGQSIKLKPKNILSVAVSPRLLQAFFGAVCRMFCVAVSLAWKRLNS